jgi:hypothetical protein
MASLATDAHTSAAGAPSREATGRKDEAQAKCGGGGSPPARGGGAVAYAAARMGQGSGDWLPFRAGLDMVARPDIMDGFVE